MRQGPTDEQPDAEGAADGGGDTELRRVLAKFDDLVVASDLAGRAGGAGAGAGAAPRRRDTGDRAATAGGSSGSGGSGAAEADPVTRARGICLRLLTGSSKTRKQLAEALAKREIPDEAAAEALDRLEAVGLIDDAAFAESWVEIRQRDRGLSRRALARELRTRGVAREVVEEAVAQVEPEVEEAAARALVERKLPATRGLDRNVRTRRLVGMLARRGYGEGVAFRVVRAALERAEEIEGAEAPESSERPESPQRPESPED